MSKKLFFCTLLLITGILSAAAPVPQKGHTAEVKVGKDNILTIDGERFYPIGVYLGPTGDEHLERISKAGFNTIICYGFGANRTPTEIKEFMDSALKHKLWVIYSIKNFLYKPGDASKKTPSGDFDAALKRFGPVIEQVKNHPALLGWYVQDEAWLVPWISKYLARLNDYVHKVDDKHPTIAVVNRPGGEGYGFFKGTSDIVGTDPYPIRPAKNKPIWAVTSYIDFARSGYGNVPLWLVVQSHNQGIYRSGIFSGIDPSYNEIRTMLFLGLTRNVEGVIFYHYGDWLKRAGRQNEEDLNLFARRWSIMKSIVTELHKLMPVLLGGTNINVKVICGSTGPSGWSLLSQARAIKYDGKIYLMAVNPTRRPIRLRAFLPKGKWEVEGYVEGGALDGKIEKDNILCLDVAALNGDTIIIKRVP